MAENGSNSSERHEAFIRAYSANEGRVKAFLRTLLPDWDAVDEAFQEASIVMWQKWEQLDSADNFFPWACMIARLKSMHVRRKHGRDRLVFDDDLWELLADEAAAESAESHQQETHALDHCLNELKQHQRELVLRAYQDKGSIKELAVSQDTTPERLYKVLARLKTRLQDCVELQLKALPQ